MHTQDINQLTISGHVTQPPQHHVVWGERFPGWQRSAASAACLNLGLKLGRMPRSTTATRPCASS
jgi:phage terminase large subunit-like protein